MRICFRDLQPKQYLNERFTRSGINIVKNKLLEQFKNCLLKKNSEKSVEGFFIVLNETPVNKSNHNGINLEIINHFDCNKKNLTPESIRCAIWRDDDDLGTFFDVVLQTFGKKNPKRKHYTSMRKICTQILNECKKLSDGDYDFGFLEFKNMLDKLSNGHNCK